jgi:hypothetical protein
MAAVSGWAQGAAAQQRPLVTEDPETIGAGLVLVEGGFDALHDIFYPASGLRGNLLRVPTVGVSFGAGSIAELQIDGAFYQRLNITDREDAPLSELMNVTGDRTSDISDFVIATKIRIVPEAPGRPALGLRFATKLPNSDVRGGLGLHTIDFFASLLVGKTVQSVRFVGNAGLGILTDPIEGRRQNDVMTYGVSVARAVRQGLEIVGEANGRINVRDDPPAGTDTRGAMRVGGRYTHSSVRVDGGLIIGMTSRDPDIGLTAGVTWVFRAFTIP